MTKTLQVAQYTELRNRVRETLILGQHKIEEAKVRTYHETGRLIHQHILQNKDRADYGEQVVEKLSTDLEIGSLVLWRCLKFARTFPILSARKELTWAHYRTLIAVPDEKQRLALADRASEGAWSSRDLEIEIRNLLWDKRVEASDGSVPSLLPVPVPGSFFTYKILQPETGDARLLIDLGFRCNRYLDAVTSQRFKPLEIIESVKTEKDHYTLKPYNSGRVIRNSPDSPRAAEPEYTYRAKLEKIVDGDTLRVVVDLGFDTTTRQYIRLKGIDCPEMDTPEGKRAKKFVETLLEGVAYLTLKTTRSDKYDRYLGDVFLPARSLKALAAGTRATGHKGGPVDGTYLYLNNELLTSRNAVRVRE